jgi:two-component system LytT family response regulator
MPDRLRALIVDDEPIARRTLRLLLESDPDVSLLGECADALDAAERLTRERPDVVFLDVQMPGVDGFELLERVGVETIPVVVFVTAHDRHAVRAFDVAATDFLLKPFDDDRFAATMRRVKAALGRPAPAGDGSATTFLRRFVVRAANRMTIVNAEEVDWIEAADYYACLHVGSKSYLVRQTMAELERGLDPAQFFRVHRSRILNLAHVAEVVMVAKGEYAAVTTGGTHVRIGRGRLDALQRRL